ncbi:hypothetical protein FRC11_006141, partial [Ceratobasidium sp. 423]
MRGKLRHIPVLAAFSVAAFSVAAFSVAAFSAVAVLFITSTSSELGGPVTDRLRESRNKGKETEEEEEE